MTFDLFAGLGQLSRRNMQYYSELKPELQKSAVPLVMSRWLTGTSDRLQLIRLNTFVNPYVFSLGQDKELLFKLAAASCTGSTMRYQWIKPPGGKSDMPLREAVTTAFYACSRREAKEYLPCIDADQFIQMGEELGWSEDEMKKLKKEVEGGSGSTKKTGAKPKSRK